MLSRMQPLALVVACLSLTVNSRRVQHHLVDDVPIRQSFVELGSAIVPSVTNARSHQLGIQPETPQQSWPPRALEPRLDTRVRPARMDAGLDVDGESLGDHKYDVNASFHGDYARVSEASIQTGDRRNLLSLGCVMVAKLAARIALRFQGDSKAREGRRLFSIDISLLVCILLWYVGSYCYSITNKIALNAAGGSAGFPITIAAAQLAVGVLYSLFLWVAPDARKRPTITFSDYKKMLPVAMSVAMQNSFAVFALSAGAVSFAQIVKSAEPVFSALIGVLFYGLSVSRLRFMSLIPIILGVTLGSAAELNFSWVALITAALANGFSAISRNETFRLMSTDGLSDRLGSVSNQFAVTQANAFMFSLPLMLALEGHKFGTFIDLVRTNPVLRNNIIYSGLWSYLYSELATMVIKKTNALSQSVLSALKRTILIVGVGFSMGETMGIQKMIGCGIAVSGAFLYSIADRSPQKADQAGDEVVHCSKDSGAK